MPIGSTNVYNSGDLILSTVSGSGTSFIETKIAAATSSLILFNSNGTLTSASLNSITVGTASYVSGSTSIITNLTASNISASGRIIASVISSSNAYFSDIGFTNQTVAPDTSVFPTGSTSDGLILDGGTYTNGLYRTRFVKVDRSSNLPLYIQETTSTSGSFRNLARFGTHANSPNTFEVFGSTNIQGAITSSNFVGPHIGNTTGTSSWSTNALTASFLPVGTYNITSSWAINASTASYVSPSGNAFVQGGNSFGTTALLGTNDAQSLALETNGTTRMSINSNGNVGIGTTVPTGSLHIQNSVANIPILNLGGGVSFNNVSDLYVLNSYNTASGVGFAAKVIGVNISGSLTNGNIPVQRTVWSGVTSATAMVLSSDDPGSGNQDNAFQIWTSNDGVAGTELTQKFSLSSTGDVGIGTTLPGEKLTVSGSSYIIGGTGAVGTGTAYYLGGSNKDISLTRVDDATLAIGRYYPSAWAETIRFTADGNVGIGTSSPDAKLHSLATTEQLRLGYDANNYTSFLVSSNGTLTLSSTNGTSTADINISPQRNLNLGTSNTDNIFIGRTDLLTGTYVRGIFSVTTTGLIQGLYQDNTGNVGIGTTGPVAQLAVTPSGSAFDSTNVMVAYFGKRTINGYGSTFIRVARVSNTTTTGSAEYTDIENNSGGSGPFRYGTYNDTNIINGGAATNGVYGSINFVTSGSTRMTIAGGTAAGNVGIGTTAPNLKLHIRDTKDDGGVALRIQNNSTNAAASSSIFFTTTTNNLYPSAEIRQDRSAGNNLSFLTDNTSKLYISGSGNVGIGTTSPVNKLQVNGNVSGSSFTSSISNAVGFLGTSSFATNASTASFASNTISSSYSLTSSFATTAQTANALNTDNSYTITGLTNNSTLSQQGTLSMGSGYQLLLTTGTAPIPSLSFVGDTNTGIYSPSADTIGFSISGSELVRINSSGNVGIGTSNPTAKLQVGTQVFGSAPDANYFVVGNNDFTGAGPVGAVNGYPVTANRNQVTASIFDVVGGWERINGSHALLRVSAYDVINSTPALTVLNNGNVGIGTPNPLARLHITASATNGESLVYLSKGSGSITQYYINAVNQLGQLNYRVSSDINGHASQTLYFAGTIHVYHDSYWSSFINNANYVQGGLGIGTTSQTHGYGVTIARPATSGSLYVSGSSVFTGSVSIRDNVGIGTTSTSDKLSVVSGSTRIASSALAGVLYLGNDGNNIYLQRDNSYDLSLVQNGDSNSALYLASAGSVYVNIDSNNNDTNKSFIVQNNALKAGTELFRIQENGNVGVGTSSPTAKLHIYNGSSHFEATSNGNAAIVSGLYALQIAPLSNRDSTAGSYYGGIAFNHLLNLNGVSTYNGAPQAWIGTRLQDTVGSERDYLVFATKPGTGVSGTGNDIPIERMCIDRDGLVGIGTTVPTARLHVSGSTIITGSLNVSANITCLSLTETSTEAVKYNILPLPSQLDNVLKLKPVSFNYKTNDKHSIGLIAEEVAKIYPEFTSDNNDSISYGKITSVLIQSIKELKTIIDNQQKQIEDLVNKLK